MATVTIATRSLKKGKTYIVQYTDPETNRKTYHRSFRRRDLAQEEANRLRTLLDSGKPLREDKGRKRTAATFGQAAELCREEWHRRRREDALSESTYNGYLALLKPVLSEWRHRLVETLDADTIREYRVRVAEERSNVLANRRLFVIKQVFAAAKAAELIERDHAASIRYLTEKNHERKRFLSPEQVTQLLAAASNMRSRHYLPLAILLAVEHGCSRQEVLDLKWPDVMLSEQENLITFHRTKNGVTRTHRIMPRTREALLARRNHLARMRERRGIKAAGDHVVGHLDGTRMNDFKTAWKATCEACGLTGLHFHDNRHTYCTNLLLAGGTLKQASVMIGHKDLRMTNRYSNLEGVRDTGAQDLLAARYATACNDG